MSNRFKAMAFAALVAGNMAATKLPKAQASTVGSPMITTNQLDINDYSPEVIRMYNAYLQGCNLENQFRTPSVSEEMADIEVANQANNLINMNFPFDGKLTEENLFEMTVDLINFYDTMTRFSVLYGIEDAKLSNYCEDEGQKQFLSRIYDIADTIRNNPNNTEVLKGAMDNLFEMVRTTNRYDYTPSVELAILQASNFLVRAMPQNYIHIEENTQQAIPLVSLEFYETDLRGNRQQVMFVPEDPEGNKYSQFSFHLFIKDEYGRDKYEGKIFTKEQLLDMGANIGGLVFELEQAYNASRDSVQKIIELNAKIDAPQKNR